MQLVKNKPIVNTDLIQKYGVALAGEYQVIPYVFYDTALYTSATTTEIYFFNVARADVNNQLTNFYQTGMLPIKESFLVNAVGVGYSGIIAATGGGAITVDATAGAAAQPAAGIINDIQLLGWNGIINFHFNHKDYGPLPLIQIPQGNGVNGQVTMSVTTAASANVFQTGTNGVPHVDDLFYTRYFIEGNNSFYVRLAWQAVQTLSRNTNIRVYLFGYLFRQVA